MKTISPRSPQDAAQRRFSSSVVPILPPARRLTGRPQKATPGLAHRFASTPVTQGGRIQSERTQSGQASFAVAPVKSGAGIAHRFATTSVSSSASLAQTGRPSVGPMLPIMASGPKVSRGLFKSLKKGIGKIGGFAGSPLGSMLLGGGLTLATGGLGAGLLGGLGGGGMGGGIMSMLGGLGGAGMGGGMGSSFSNPFGMLGGMLGGLFGGPMGAMSAAQSPMGMGMQPPQMQMGGSPYRGFFPPSAAPAPQPQASPLSSLFGGLLGGLFGGGGGMGVRRRKNNNRASNAPA